MISTRRRILPPKKRWRQLVKNKTLRRFRSKTCYEYTIATVAYDHYYANVSHNRNEAISFWKILLVRFCCTFWFLWLIYAPSILDALVTNACFSLPASEFNYIPIYFDARYCNCLSFSTAYLFYITYLLLGFVYRKALMKWKMEMKWMGA